MKDVYEYIEKDCKDWIELSVLEIANKNSIFLQDSEGYKYTTSLSVIKNARRRGLNLNRFFRNNPNTIDNIKNYLKIYDIKYTLINELIENAKSNATWNCPIHGNFLASWNSIQSGGGCPECGKLLANSKTRNSYEYVENVFKDSNLKLISKTYKNNLKPLEFICNLHKDKGVQTTSFGNLITSKCVCAYCSRERNSMIRTKTHDEFLKDIYRIHGEDISIIGKYEGGNKHIKARCNKCNHLWSTKATHLISGHGCPACKSPSKGEDLIREYLNNNNINFKEQYRIKECRYKKPLPFDFSILDNDNNLLCLIEFDGKQHFKPTGFGCNSEDKINEGFKLQKIRDKIKDSFCEDKEIKLIRIPYWDIENIESILDTELSVPFNAIK